MLDLLFPPRCVLCGRLLNRNVKEQLENGLCELCDWQDYQNHQITAQDMHCSLIYEEHLQRAIQRLKYEGKKQYGIYFARWMMAEGRDWAATQNFDRMTAVPLARKRMKSRGYNQAEVIARELSRICRISYEELLERKRETCPQSHLNAQQRRENMREVFAVKEAQAPKHVCLIDDIYTTGSTLQACREALLKKWPDVKVHYWVLAGRNSPNFL